MESIFHKRINKIFNHLSDIDLNGLYITNMTNIKYLTGFSGSSALLLLFNDKAYFLTDGRYTTQAQAQIINADIHIIESNYFTTIKKISLFHDKDLNIGFESNHMAVYYFNELLKYFSNINWHETISIIENIAAVKDQSEIDSLAEAVKITDKVFDEIIPEIKVGVTEKYISAKISFLFKTNGAEGDSYESIIAGGPNSALPHARPTDREFRKGDFIVMDFGALYNGYHADMTRTLLVGPASQRHKEIYNIVLESQIAGINFAKAGVKCSEVDFACRNIITNKGYGDLFTHSTGHGLGLEVHTLPRIHKTNHELLEKNNVITIEPGIYVPNWGGVRIEDDCLITLDGCVPLNKSTKELIII